MLDGVKLSGFHFTDRLFDHILIIEPDQDLDINSLIAVCQYINFPLSQIYIFGKKGKKIYYKKFLFPYWKIKNITSFLNNHGRILRLIGKYFVVVKNFSAFLSFNSYINNIAVVSLSIEPYERIRIFDSLHNYGFSCKNIESKKSLWVRNSQ